MTKVSVIMGAYNCENSVGKAIDSILNQEYKDWELIICDDGSQDNTIKVLNSYQRKHVKKIKVLKNNHNKGLNYTLNKCILECTGDYIARQDADDVSLPDRFMLQVDFLESNKEFSIVGSNMFFLNDGQVFGETNYPRKPTQDDLMRHTIFAHPTVLMRKADLLKVGCYTVEDKYIRVEDYLLWHNFLKNGYRGYNLKKSLYVYTEDENAYARRNFKNRLNESRLKIEILRYYKLPIQNYIHVAKPIMTLLVPKSIYVKIRENKYKVGIKYEE